MDYWFKKLAYFLNYFIVAYVFCKFTKSDSAEIKKARAKIKKLNVERERLQKKVAIAKDKTTKKELNNIEKEIKNMVPKDKVDHFNDLLDKL